MSCNVRLAAPSKARCAIGLLACSWRRFACTATGPEDWPNAQMTGSIVRSQHGGNGSAFTNAVPKSRSTWPAFPNFSTSPATLAALSHAAHELDALAAQLFDAL